MLEAVSITSLHHDLTIAWHDPAAPQPTPSDDLLSLVASQHRENFDLWHEEDKARDPESTDADIARVKHAIDHLNQRRNDLVEKIDLWLLANLPPQNPAAPLNSETPGLIIDRLSILALQASSTPARKPTAPPPPTPTASATPTASSSSRSSASDLAACLDAL